jgi:hypothetical protein
LPISPIKFKQIHLINGKLTQPEDNVPLLT